MKFNFASGLPNGVRLAAISVTLLLVAGCATRNTMSGGKETTVLGGAYTVATESFQPIPPTTINMDTSNLVGKKGPSGKKVTLLWGLITLHDY